MENIQLLVGTDQNLVSKKIVENLISTSYNSLLTLENKTGRGNEYLGWMELPYSDIYQDINATAKLWREKYETIVIIGIGGSYLGARAVISALSNNFMPTNPEILYAGNNLSEDYHNELLEYLNGRNFAVVVISKSGTTTEPAIAFRLLKEKLEQKYGVAESVDRIIAITDAHKGALKTLALKNGYKTYDIADDVGGRFSVLSPVGLLPIAIAGFDIVSLLKGAQDLDEMSESSKESDKNIVLQYAAMRNALYNNGKKIEIMVSFEPKLFYFIEWWKQLYGESEGKEGKGIYPSGVINTTDLHSLGQYIQDGERVLFETVLTIESNANPLMIPMDKEDLDKLNYLNGKSMFDVNKKAEQGTMEAHIDGNVPNLRITIPKMSEYYLGQLIMFFEKACGISAYNLGVNPFDQPGVEAYKKNMFRLLGKE